MLLPYQNFKRRNKNRTTSLRNDGGQWIEEETEVRPMLNFFIRICLKRKLTLVLGYIPLLLIVLFLMRIDCPCKMIYRLMKSRLLFLIWESGNYVVLMAFPRVSIIKLGVRQELQLQIFVKNVWNNPNDISCVNNTDVCLIPKVGKPKFVSQLRHISLCNTIYKVVTKVVVN